MLLSNILTLFLTTTTTSLVSAQNADPLVERAIVEGLKSTLSFRAAIHAINMNPELAPRDPKRIGSTNNDGEDDVNNNDTDTDSDSDDDDDDEGRRGARVRTTSSTGGVPRPTAMVGAGVGSWAALGGAALVVGAAL
ncbi:hypothetical protein AJ80_06985 [Polytolypa hystricis UAMH7299]|uniref:Uncharacterized protein n=1 Tax=Polytolypa hystricis (strain UAMH7299) TaxID=1447883 RepID=A0A2B7XJ18_POLH7|nr:hypothetical protein AJ80_06985 [Polytolypa hystricis UAMH7299]